MINPGYDQSRLNREKLSADTSCSTVTILVTLPRLPRFNLLQNSRRPRYTSLISKRGVFPSFESYLLAAVGPDRLSCVLSFRLLVRCSEIISRGSDFPLGCCYLVWRRWIVCASGTENSGYRYTNSGAACRVAMLVLAALDLNPKMAQRKVEGASRGFDRWSRASVEFS